MTPDPFRRSLRRGGRGPGLEPQDQERGIWAAVDGLPAVVLTVAAPAMFVMIDGLAVRVVPEADANPGPALPGTTVRVRYAAGRLEAS